MDTPTEPPTDVPAGPAKPGPKIPIQPIPSRLFEGIVLTRLDARTRNILRELQQLDVDRFPNACAALLRAIIELAVTEVMLSHSWPGQSFREMVKKCVFELDRNKANLRYEAVRTGLNDGTSMFAVSTLHAWLHNQHFHATPSEVRANASNYAPFLVGLDTLLR